MVDVVFKTPRVCYNVGFLQPKSIDILLISPSKHILWLLIRNASPGRFFCVPQRIISRRKKRNIFMWTSCISGGMRTCLIELGLNDTSTLVGHFVSSPREREKRDRRDCKGDEREGQGRKRNRNESEETEKIKTPSLLYPYLLQGWQALTNC